MIDASDAAEPIESTDATDPIEPIESADPTEPIDNTEPREPIERIELCDQSDHFEAPPEHGFTAPSITGVNRLALVIEVRFRWDGYGPPP
jgi:hypothetical protein